MKRLKKSRTGQSTVEYVLMVGFGAVLAVQVVNFFNGVFREGLVRLEVNVGNEMATGQRFPNARN